ncbi:MAG: AMP-binding protein [Burkholderiales bacterium]|nr:AMP-binding protein [Burkholderiales bacterium]
MRYLERAIDQAVDVMTGGDDAATVVGLLADNSAHWIAIDLAAQVAGVSLVPLPGFFSREQLGHAVRASGMQALFCADRDQAAALGFADRCARVGPLHLFCVRGETRPAHDAGLGRAARKLSFTSGTTGTPKPVLLSAPQQLATAHALAARIAALGIRRHLSLLPLPVLLENVAGVYTALTLGAACICPPLEQIGVHGASGFEPKRCLEAIAHYRPDSLILLPQMLHALVARLATDPGLRRALRMLKFVAVGGAKTPAPLIERARELGLPVYEGYGLTECASVVSLNTPGADRIGSVGVPLEHLRVRLASDGEIEIEIAGPACSGCAQTAGGWLPTGDLGTIDGQGFLSILGRKKNVIVTSFGRNVSPEWPESLLLEHPQLAQAAVFGEARPCLVAVLVVSSPVDDAALDRLVAGVNRRLPDYARIHAWLRAEEPFTARNALATANGRVRRDAVLQRYGRELSALYRRAGCCSPLPEPASQVS